MFRCTIEDDASKKSLEVPQWMFDRAICCGMRLVDTPVLGVCELRALKALLGHVSVTTSADFRQDQHFPSTPKGDVDAKTAKSSPDSSAGPLSSTSNPTPVVNATVANPAAHDSTAGTAAARTPRETARLRHRKGGVR